MKILAIDIGTGTQDILLYDSHLDLENGYKLVVPSPTMIVYRRLQAATRQQEAVLLTGVTMGGGPSQWAAEAHANAGLPIFATPDAARTFNDDLVAVREMGIQVVGEEEAQKLPDSVTRLELRDFDFPAIVQALKSFGVSLGDLSAVAIAVFDHGNAPTGVSDRQFRFDYLDDRIRQEIPFRQPLSAFAFPPEKVPEIMTRLQAVVHSARQDLPDDLPLMVMDTAPAAVLGALFDPVVAARHQVIIANIGNFHTLAFRLDAGSIAGVFEHHTGLLELPSLESLLRRLADGTLKHADVFDNHGHGALIYDPSRLALGKDEFDIVVTGPRRGMFQPNDGSLPGLKPYFAVPYGDMMLAGCIGLLAASADVYPEFAEQIYASLRGIGERGTPPWEVP